MNLKEKAEYLKDFKPNRYITYVISKKLPEELTAEDKEYIKKNKLYKSKDYKRAREKIRKKQYYENNKEKIKQKRLEKNKLKIFLINYLLY